MIRLYRPTHVAIAFDGHEKTFRHELYPLYKAGRKEKEAMLIDDLSIFQTLLVNLGIGIVAPSRYEADDLIATLINQWEGSAIVYSGDRDLFQLADDQTSILFPSPKHKSTILLAPADIQEMMGVHACQIGDLKALEGDTSDNIPGVRGIGATMAVKLLSQYDSVEHIYYHVHQNSGTMPALTRLKAGEADAISSKALVKLVNNVPVPEDVFAKFDLARIGNLELFRFESRLRQLGLSEIALNYYEGLPERLCQEGSLFNF